MGLGNLRIDTPTAAGFNLAVWLEGDEYLGLVEHYRNERLEPSCLLDVIALWIDRTDALLYFPTFQTFLLAVLEIVNEWQADDLKRVFGQLLWPLGDGDGDGDGLTITTVAGWVEDGAGIRDVSEHPIMREENFLLHQRRLQNESSR